MTIGELIEKLKAMPQDEDVSKYEEKRRVERGAELVIIIARTLYRPDAKGANL